MGQLLLVIFVWFAVSLVLAPVLGRAVRTATVGGTHRWSNGTMPSPVDIDLRVDSTPRHPAAVAASAVAAATTAAPAPTTTATAAGWRAIDRIISDHAFTPHYQPIVALVDGRREGYEALTRFTDGSSPELRFGQATVLGLGLRLEVATLRAALDAAESLGDDTYLSVNVSPSLLSRPDTLAELLDGAGRDVVIELSEQERVDDYETLSRALGCLPGGIRLSIDDVGSGFASLRHILLLEPTYVKLDLTWVKGVDRDPARRALIAGLRHFADSIGAYLVAEGVECADERDALVDLGVDFGQGWLLGRPQPPSGPQRQPERALGTR